MDTVPAVAQRRRRFFGPFQVAAHQVRRLDHHLAHLAGAQFPARVLFQDLPFFVCV